MRERGGDTLCPQQILLFVVGASGILKKWNFQRTPEIYGFWNKIFFSKILCLVGSGPFICTFSEIWKMVFTWSMSKFSQQKLNLLVLMFFCFKYNNYWLRIHKLHQCKQFQMIFVNRCYYMSNLDNSQRVV